MTDVCALRLLKR